MYAIIRTGGKQTKVRAGDVIDVELLKGEGEVEFTPLLVVADDGAVTSDPSELAGAKVVAEIVGASAGPKVDIFKYKNKTGYRNRGGHRQKYTRIRVERIELAGSAEPKAEKPKAEKPKAAEPKAAEPKAEKPKAEKPEPETKKAPKATPKAEAPVADEDAVVDATTDQEA